MNRLRPFEMDCANAVEYELHSSLVDHVRTSPPWLHFLSLATIVSLLFKVHHC